MRILDARRYMNGVFEVEGANHTRTRDISANDGLQWHDLRLLDQHRSPLELILILPHLLGHLVDIRSHDVVRDRLSQTAEPEQRYLRQQFALVRDTLETRAIAR